MGSQPVFVVGSARSGTTLLYHLLVASGEFANYRAETHFFDLFLPRFGDPRNVRNRARLADAWLRSAYHARTGLGTEALREELMARGVSAGRFLDTILSSVAEAQGRSRWAECTPAHLRHMVRIRQELPTARFIHVVRDGRAVALSLAPRNWVRPLPWDRHDPFLVASWAWRREVRSGRVIGRSLGTDYREVRFEDLVTDPRACLSDLESFVGTSLDYDRLLETGLGSISSPNSSFGDTETESAFDPVRRWESALSADVVERIELSVGDLLAELGYAVRADGTCPYSLKARRAMFEAVRWARDLLVHRTPAGRLICDPDSAAPPRGAADDG